MQAKKLIRTALLWTADGKRRPGTSIRNMEKNIRELKNCDLTLATIEIFL
uniref:Uncharacterized protein n=1 Tax=Arion vulgaris TaxID=1028688 RepID=A0A0B7A007_9EUPU